MDFTLKVFESLLSAFLNAGYRFTVLADYFSGSAREDRRVILKHDIDRKPENALILAKLEKHLGIRASYYFRKKKGGFEDNVIKEIKKLGHEIGYHYESLSDTNGDLSRALEDFKNNLMKFRRIVPVQTISMHGRPLKSYDNRDIWRDPQNHQLLVDEIAVLGEVYLDIDYRDIVYITDTGRNWSPIRSNIRGHIESSRKLDLRNGLELYRYLSSNPYPRLVFQVHPERWTENLPDYFLSVCFDAMANTAKSGVNFVRDKRQ